MTDKELKDLVASLAIESKKTDEQIKALRLSQKETDKQMKETDKQMKQTDKRINKLDEMGARWDNFLGNYGESVEEYFYRSLEKEKNTRKTKIQ